MLPSTRPDFPPVPLLAIAAFLIALLLLDLAFEPTPEVLAAFVPGVVWALIIVFVGRS